MDLRTAPESSSHIQTAILRRLFSVHKINEEIFEHLTIRFGITANASLETRPEDLWKCDRDFCLCVPPSQLVTMEISCFP